MKDVLLCGLTLITFWFFFSTPQTVGRYFGELQRAYAAAAEGK